MERQVQSSALVMRVVKYCFVVSGILFVYIAFKILTPPQHEASQPIQIAITAAGLWSVASGFYFPRWISRRVEARSRTLPVEEQVKRWKAMCILSLAYFESCILFGLVLHLLGGRNVLVGSLMGAGIAAELIWNPGKPPGAESGELPRG